MLYPEVRILDARSLGNLTGVINHAAQARADRVAGEAAEEMEQEVKILIAQDLVNDRPGNRRKAGMKIIDSVEGVVADEGTTRVVARLQSKRGARHKAVGALEHGWDAFQMIPRDGEFLWMPQPGTGRIYQAYHKADKRFRYVVNHGHAGYHFFQRAREHVRQRLVRR